VSQQSAVGHGGPVTLERRDGGSIADQIGRTPLLRIHLFDRDLPEGVEIYAKAEFMNPGGSVKDRPALRMIEDGEQSGRLVSGKVILDIGS